MITTDIRRIQAKAVKARKKSQAKAEQSKVKAAELRSRQVDRVVFEDVIDGIKVINIDSWLAGVYPRRDVLSPFRPSDFDGRLFNWCQKNKAHYYVRRFEKFNLSEGVKEAISLKRKLIVYDTLE